MTCRRFITQFYHISPLRDIPQRYVIKKTSKKLYKFKNQGSHLRKYDEYPLKAIVWTGPYGKYLLYAVRVIDSYVLSHRKYSKLISSQSKLYKELVKKHVIPESQAICDEFKDFTMIDFESVVQLCNRESEAISFDSHAEIITFPAYEWVIKLDDVYIHRIGKNSMVSYIPCLFENKVITEVFIETSTITDEFRQRMKEGKFKTFTSAYSPDAQTIQEILDSLDTNF